MAGEVSIDDAWAAAAEVVAAAYRLDRAVLLAESRGRGPRPPREVWEAKKLCVYVAVATSGCAYKHLADRIGLHKDTVASHCDDVRELAAEDAAFETRANALIENALQRVSRPARTMVVADEITLAAMWRALDDRLGRIEALLRARPLHPSQTDEKRRHPSPAKTHENVITMALPGRRPR